MKILKWNKISIIALAFSLAIFITSCTSGETAGSCDDSTHCTDYIGADHTAEGVKAACLGSYSTDSCKAATNGTCVINSGQPNETSVSYYDSTLDISTCDAAGGTFAN